MLDKLPKYESQLVEVEQKLSSPETAANPRRYQELSRQHKWVSAIVENLRGLQKCRAEIAEAREMIQTADDDEMIQMAREELAALEARATTLEESIQLNLIPPEPEEGKDIILEIRAGTGGEEAALFAGDLMRMYTKYAEQVGLKTELIQADQTGVGGFKEIILAVRGDDAYKLLIGEGGGHRVQRIPVTESGGRIHTSAATVAVYPEAEETEVNINENDLRIDYFRSSGPGGQSVNTTDSAVRVTHVPTGIVVSCQDEKSQLKNRAKAMRVLRARLYQAEQEARHASLAAEKKEMIGSGDRSQRIRTYNFPQNRVTDHRCGFTSHNLEEIINGNMEDLVKAVVRHRIEQKLAALDQAG